MTPTATPEPTRPGRAGGWSRLHLVVAVVAVAAAAIAIAVSRSDGSGRAAPSSTTEPAPVAVTSDAPAHATLDELVAASDLIVRARVRGTEPGRWFGDSDDGPRIRSRLVSLDVEATLVGDPVPDLLVEEEGWTEDSAPLVVDGASPTEPGDTGIWFLVDPGDATTGGYIVVNAQGRYLEDAGGRAAGAHNDDPLVAELSSGSIDDLAERISRTPPRP